MRGGRCALRCGSDHCAPCTGFGVCEPARHEMRHEGGSAPVEFIGWTLILAVPVLYLLVAFAQVQSASFAVASAADAAGRVLEVEKGEAAMAHARVAVDLALSDQHIDADPAGSLSLTCSDDECAKGVVRVEAGVDLPILGAAGIGRDVVVLHAERAVSLAGPE